MANSLKDYLAVISSHIHPALISPEAFSRIQELGQYLPLCPVAGFEARLCINQPVVDLITRLPYTAPDFSKTFLTHPTWQALDILCKELRQENSDANQIVQVIDLEFDLDQPLALIPIPCLFFSLKQDGDRTVESLLKAMQYIPHYSYSEILATNLKRCIEALPTGAKASYLGAMLSRPNQLLRLVIGGIKLNQIPDYLQGIDWQYSIDELLSVVATLSSYVDEFGMVGIDIYDEKILPKIGIECYIRGQENDLNRWEQFLTYLVNIGLCSATKREALLKWPGISQYKPQANQSLDGLQWGDLMLRNRAHSVFWRNLNHVKIVYQPDRPLEAKAYLGFGHSWLDAQTMTQN